MMKKTSGILLILTALCLLGGCTQRRTASEPVPDGDTVEVVIEQGP